MSKKIKIGNTFIGGGEEVKIQSMCNVKTSDVKKCTEQILSLEKAGCEIVRVAVPDMESAVAIEKIKENIHIPIVADIHFDYRLALEAMERGIDKVRINPGNIGSEEGVKAVAKMAKAKNIPIRIGVNSGSIEKEILEKYSHPTPEGMVESAKKHIDMLNRYDFDDIVISLKSSSVPMTIDAYRLMSKTFDYPLHLGVTEAGTFLGGTVKSAIGIGSLLKDGIGDTIRVSLTDDVEKEVLVAKEILSALEIRRLGAKLVSCPTCARTSIDLIGLANEVEKYLQKISKPITVAVMGCVVNGPGEAREADIGIAGGKGEGLIFKKGQIVKKVKEEFLLSELIEEIEKM
ncbi:MAG: flavodoxin-dependent (E)-4-hydroxy-3-methylbut-2-enyl-diphosphate synthase [Ruminococcaceae bacterium]|nr:flavodoxin-dependent (E)-4-hydroxy-3-methylbut-2-enyl-diphosphate synthase [Oscillospiraceae bacterium]